MPGKVVEFTLRPPRQASGRNASVGNGRSGTADCWRVEEKLSGRLETCHDERTEASMARFLHVCSCLSAPVLLIHGFSNDEAGQPKKKAKKSQGEVVELFNLADDPSEKTNLAAQHPERVRELRARLDAYAKEAVPPKSAPKKKDFQSPKVWGEP